MGRCYHWLQSGPALGQSVGVIGKGPIVFLEARGERDCLKSFNGRIGVGEEPRTPGRVGHQLLQEEITGATWGSQTARTEAAFTDALWEHGIGRGSCLAHGDPKALRTDLVGSPWQFS